MTCLLRTHNSSPTAYIRTMLRKQLNIPPAAAQQFVRNMRAFFKAKTQLKSDEIAADTAWMLKQHLPRGTKLRLVDVKELFHEMRDQV